MTVECDDERCEFNELVLVEKGVSLASWHAMTGRERIGLVSRWFSELPPRTRREARDLLGVTLMQWAAMGSTARYDAARAALTPHPAP